MGGTFMSLPAEYRDYFVRNLHDALSGHASSSVGEAVAFSEQSRTKCIGLTIETRPDYCLTPHLTQVRGWLGSAAFLDRAGDSQVLWPAAYSLKSQ